MALVAELNGMIGVRSCAYARLQRRAVLQLAPSAPRDTASSIRTDIAHL